jgi:cytochrome P450
MTTTHVSIDSDIDLFTDEALHDPFPLYRELRDRGPATYLTSHGVWLLSRYDEVRAALTDWKTFSSAEGAGLNPVINEAWSDAVICVDPPVHTQMRKLFMERLGPRQLKPIAATIDERADQLAESLIARGSFDGVADLANDLPVNVIMDLVGWPETERDRLLEFAAGSFDCCGPQNERMQASMPKLAASVEYVTEIFDSKRLAPGTFGYTIAEAADQGEISKDAAIGLLLAYVVAAFDTTINAIGSGMWLFAQNAEQWKLLRADPSLAPAAVNEILRMESPIQFFSRVTTREVELSGGVTIPAGARVLHSYGAANRDERHFPDPDRFDIRRNPVDHIAFGAGNHGCAGQSLARLEANAVFQAMAKRVGTVELAGEPVRALNNVTRGFSAVPLRTS